VEEYLSGRSVGVEILFNYDPDYPNEKDIVAEIFIEMLKISTNHRREHP
jgi:hypothetical protein